ncbi:hypothetical protein H0R92_01600 [Treponema sp. OMZ 840]|uniref:hypothetical protein n=1 Tax=Treponema sp. OMZ 840 TaxID=244313 RepID=UPI003D914344
MMEIDNIFCAKKMIFEMVSRILDANLPSYGLRAFVPGYDNLPKNEQRTFIIAEL